MRLISAAVVMSLFGSTLVAQDFDGDGVLGCHDINSLTSAVAGLLPVTDSFGSHSGAEFARVKTHCRCFKLSTATPELRCHCVSCNFPASPRRIRNTHAIDLDSAREASPGLCLGHRANDRQRTP